jgi:hypothetical protein
MGVADWAWIGPRTFRHRGAGRPARDVLPNTHDVWLTVLTLREQLRGFLLVHLDDALLADGRAGGATVPDFAVDFGYVVQAAPERDAAQPSCVGWQGEEFHDCTPRRVFCD